MAYPRCSSCYSESTSLRFGKCSSCNSRSEREYHENFNQSQKYYSTSDLWPIERLQEWWAPRKWKIQQWLSLKWRYLRIDIRDWNIRRKAKAAKKKSQNKK